MGRSGPKEGRYGQVGRGEVHRIVARGEHLTDDSKDVEYHEKPGGDWNRWGPVLI
jgi:hypothetical protein